MRATNEGGHVKVNQTVEVLPREGALAAKASRVTRKRALKSS